MYVSWLSSMNACMSDVAPMRTKSCFLIRQNCVCTLKKTVQESSSFEIGSKIWFWKPISPWPRRCSCPWCRASPSDRPSCSCTSPPHTRLQCIAVLGSNTGAGIRCRCCSVCFSSYLCSGPCWPLEFVDLLKNFLWRSILHSTNAFSAIIQLFISWAASVAKG